MQRYNWDIVLDLLESEIWIDKQTRVVFVEFVINNMNANIFTQVKILLETPIFGGNDEVFPVYRHQRVYLGIDILCFQEFSSLHK